MRLHDLKPRPGAKHRRKRLGQGESSGHGKTSGRGGKGQTARSGSSIRIGFEGGQMPLIRRIPKRGFNNARFTTQYVAVNVGELNKFEDGAKVDEAALRAIGLANGRAAGVKDILTKSLGSKNAANVVKATLKALLSLRLRENIYKGRGIEIKKVETPKAPELTPAAT